MSAVFVRSVLRSCPELFTRVVRFNQHPAATLHADYIPAGVDPRLFGRLVQSPGAERALSRWVTRQHGLSPAGFWRFEYPPQRLALLDPPQLQSLLQFAAAAALHVRITGLIGGTQIREAKQALGEAAYSFALRRASLAVGPKPVEPEWAAGAPLSADRLHATGVSWLRSCLGNDSPELLKRTSLKLPSGWAITPDTPAAAVDRDRCWRILKRILLTEIAPELAPCFN